MHRLDKAGGAVKRASDDLINAAKDAREAKVDVHVSNPPQKPFYRPIEYFFPEKII